MLEDVVDVGRDVSVLGVIIGAIEEDLAVLQHLQQLVELDRVQFADLVQEQDAAVGLGDRSGLGLRDAGHAQRPRPLIDRVMHRTDQRVGDAPLVKAGGSGVQLDELGMGAEGRARVLLGLLQHQSGNGGLAHAGRAVDQDVLGVGAAECCPQCLQAVFLANDLLEALRTRPLRERLRQGDPA